jgi:class 3 adenylate cyclase
VAEEVEPIVVADELDLARLERDLRLGSLGFLDPSVQHAYVQWRRRTVAPFMRVALSTAALAWLGASIATYMANPEAAKRLAPWVLLMMMPVLGAALATTVVKRRGPFMVPAAALANVTSGAMACILGFSIFGRTDVAMGALTIVIYFACTILRLPLGVSAVTSLGCVVAHTVIAARFFAHGDITRETFVVTISLPMIAVSSGLMVCAAHHRTARQSYRQERMLEAQARALELERSRADELLESMLPARIAERLKAAPEAMAEHLGAVTIVFVDIVDFTKLSEVLEPAALVNFLNAVFARFDSLADEHGVEKIKTVGDAYMAVAGVPDPRPDHAEAAADLALAMRDAVPELRRDTGVRFEVRTGLHSGPVIAGVIGRRKFAYDLWGDAVNVAARMEAHGVSGEIQVSETVHALLRHRYRFRERGVVEVKGKGPMRTWLLEGRVVAQLAPAG